MASSLVNIGTTQASAASSVAVAVPAGGIPAGALIVVEVYDAAGHVNAGAVTDSAGNIYTKAKELTSTCIFYAWNCLALVSANSIIYTKADSTSIALVSASYSTAVLSAFDPLDSAVSNSNTSTNTGTPTVTSGTPTQAGELFVACLFWQTNGNFGFSQAANWSNLPNQVNGANNTALSGGSIINNSTAAQTYTPTVSAMSGPPSYIMLIVAFKANPPPFTTTHIATASASAATTMVMTVPAGGVPVGSLIAVCSFDGGGAENTVTDSAGNTYRKVASIIAVGSMTANMFYAWNCAVLTSGQTITVAKATSTDGAAATAFYATGVMNTSDPLDTAVTNSKTATQTGTPTITSGTPTQIGELIVGSLIWNNGGVITFTQMSNWSTPPNQSDAFSWSVVGGNTVNASLSPQTYNPTVGAMSSSYGMIIAGFKAAAAGAKSGFNMPMMGI